MRCLLFLLFFSFSSFLYSKNQIFYFEPNIVELSGMVRILKFPGPPNYESIKNGDAEEVDGYLILSKPIDIHLMPGIQIGNDAIEKNIRFIQFVVQRESDWERIKEGNYVHVVGTLFSALTGHHHARVLLTIKKIDVLSTHKIINNKKLDVTKEDLEFLKNQNLAN